MQYSPAGEEACCLHLFFPHLADLQVGRNGISTGHRSWAACWKRSHWPWPGGPGPGWPAPWASTVSRTTLIRLIRALPDPGIGQVTVLGVDDFAKRRGHSYATILIDMDTHQPIDVLEDRQAGTLAQWLKDTPACRSSAGTGRAPMPRAPGREHRTPSRWPTASTCGRTCATRSRRPSSPAALTCQNPTPQPGGPEPAGAGSGVPAETTGPAAGQDPGDGRLATRARERHAAIHDLLAQGKNYTQISEILGLTRHTVRKFARAADRRPGDHRAQPPLQQASTVSPPTCSSAGTRDAPTPPSCSPRSRQRATPAASAQRAATCSRCAPRSLLPCSRRPRRPSGR